MAFLIGGANSAADTGYDVANSCRFEDGDSAHMTKSSSAGVNDKGTLSVWIKRGNLGTDQNIYNPYTSSNTLLHIYFASDNTLKLYVYDNGSTIAHLVTDAEYRDCSAWYHIVLAIDSDQGTAANRMKLYVNGTQVTSFSSSGYPDSGADMQINNSGTTEVIGRYQDGTQKYFDGYMAEFVWIDGTQYAASDFGEFDEDSPTIWKPKDVSGLTFGTNGYYLDFEASDNLGNDVNGGTDLTETNLAATDQATDTPTNNFCTLNPLDNNIVNLPTLSEGNLEVLAVSGSTWSITPGTIALPKSGKWYYEVEAVSGTGGDRAAFAGWANPEKANPLGDGSMFSRNSNGRIMQDDTQIATGYTDWDSDGDIVGCYIDMDNSKLYWAMNGTIQASGTGISFAGGFDDADFILPMVQVINTDKLSVNFGNPATNFAIASGNADANGYGNFEYDPSDGGSSSFDSAAKDFYAICTKNLAEFG